MEIESKDYIKHKLATCFREILKRKKKIEMKNKKLDIKDLRLVASMRQLEADSGLSYTIIQGVSVGKRDVQFSSLMIIIESLGLTFSEFAKMYDRVSDEQIKKTVVEIEANKRIRPSIKKKN